MTRTATPLHLLGVAGTGTDTGPHGVITHFTPPTYSEMNTSTRRLGGRVPRSAIALTHA